MSNPILEAMRRFIVGGPAPMEPTLQEVQQGAPVSQPGQTRRPGFLPITRDAQTGQMQLALPRVLDILGNALPGAVPSAIAPVKAAAGEKVLTSGLSVGGSKPYSWMKPGDVIGLQKSDPELFTTLMATEPDYAAKVKEFGLAPEAKPGIDWSKPFEENFPGVLKQEAAPQPIVDLLNDDEAWNTPTTKAWMEEAVKGPAATLGQKPWTQANEEATYPVALAPKDTSAYQDIVEASFGTLDKGKEFYKGFLDKGYALTTDEKHLIKALWPDLKVPEPSPLPALKSWNDEWSNRKASRMLYEGDILGPPLPQRDLPMDTASRMTRAEELGWDTSQTLYTGVPTWGDVWPVAFKDPLTRPSGYERAIFLSDKPKVANSYTGGASKGHRGPIFPVFAKMDNPMEVNWREYAGTEAYSSASMEALIDEALEAGHDSVIARGMDDLGGMQDQYLVFNPNQLRSIFAKFDPKNASANDLTAALALTFGLGAAAKELPNNAK